MVAMLRYLKSIHARVGITLLLLNLGACAPQYETRYELIPPTSSSGLQCLKSCEVASGQCRNQCNQRYDQCSLKAEQQAKAALPQLMQAYEIELAVWREQRDRYQREKFFYDMQRDRLRALREACNLNQGGREACPRIHSGLSRPVYIGSAPTPPDLARETQRIREATCTTNCQCDTQYRTCYSSCGGTVKPQQVCMRHCNE